MLPGLEADAAARAEKRLDDQTILWLTTVTASGQPQTSPVGYTWDGTTILILSAPDAPKIRNLRGNGKVSLHLDLDTTSETSSVLTLEGVAVVEPGGTARLEPKATEAYVEKHRESIQSAGLTPAEAFEQLSTAIRVTPTRARGY